MAAFLPSRAASEGRQTCPPPFLILTPLHLALQSFLPIHRHFKSRSKRAISDGSCYQLYTTRINRRKTGNSFITPQKWGVVIRVKMRNLSARQQTAVTNLRFHWQRYKTETKTTQAEASKALGWSHSVLGQYINGHVACGPTAIFKIAELIGVTPYDIDPELRGEFTPPAEDLHDLRTALSKMTRQEKARVIMTVARKLGREDLLQITNDLLALAIDRA